MRRLTCILAAALLLMTPGIKGVAEDAVDAQIEAVLEVCVEELGYTGHQRRVQQIWRMGGRRLQGVVLGVRLLEYGAGG